MIKTVSVTFGAATLALLSFSPALAANWLNSMVGNWSVQAQANQTQNQTQIRLVISSQESQEGSGHCQRIVGTMTDVTPPGQSKPSDSIEGFYCPRSSRVSFLRKNRSTNDTFQVYIGDLSPDTGNILSIGGVFAYAQERGAQLGEYVYSVVSGEHPEAVFTGSKKQCLKYIRDNAFLGS